MRAGSDDIVIGVGATVPTLGGRSVPYVDLDNVGATPTFRAVLDAVDELLPYHASVHTGRGSSHGGRSEALDDARATIARFVGADPGRDVVAFTAEHSHEAVNVVAGSVTADWNVLTGRSTSTSSTEGRLAGNRPWSSCRGVERHRRRPARSTTSLPACTPSAAASWSMPPTWRRIVRSTCSAHADARHLDFVALSSHTMYAPFGSVALDRVR